ncbi:hypothetical protein C8A05DRAFT_20346 [Staphylotrichum tortipilum]|uniref:Uncharacterized protein n=1 Tax=Staphylotrichum tortipilum TaxID=2831512 RepID=A0AAN6MAC3_9PEZI|nr:hypothetical protein C8A05DRAFT_20346 [Staphylotrichum longicolle]
MTSPSGEYERLPIEKLGTPHREILTRAIANVAATPIAKQTFAQIVDGLPLSNVAWDSEAQELCSSFDTSTLLMSSKLLQDYESAPPGSPGFSTRLIELVARAVHQIASWLYTRDTSRHKDDALGRWRPAEERKRLYPATFPTTLFCHPWYRDYDQYPEGIADSVGYWAEGRILGGVVLFDRRDPDSPDAIYIHADRRLVIYRICRLLDTQTRELTEFLLSDTAPLQHCPLPMLPSEANRQRVDPEQAIQKTGIYRDPWERRLRPLDAGDARLRDVIDLFNYVSKEDYREAKQRAYRERERRERRERREERE